ERTDRLQPDISRHAAFDLRRQRRLADRQAVEQLRRENVEAGTATVVDGADAVVGGGLQLRAVHRQNRELRTQTADVDARAFTGGVALDLNSRQTLQRFGEIQIRKLADVFGEDRIGEVGVLALRGGRVLERAPEAG